MGWFSDLFSNKDKWEETEYHPEIKNISEPVLSFINCVKENPRRFRIQYSGVVIDRQTGTRFCIYQGFSSYIGDGEYNHYYEARENTNWMTRDEMEYAYLQLRLIQQDKVKACKNKQRQKYIQIYVEGE